jgi:hypothetical protein
MVAILLSERVFSVRPKFFLTLVKTQSQSEESESFHPFKTARAFMNHTQTSEITPLTIPGLTQTDWSTTQLSQRYQSTENLSPYIRNRLDEVFEYYYLQLIRYIILR